MTNKTILIFLISIGFMLGSCKHGTDLTGLPTVSFKDHVAPLLSSKCSFSGCHGNIGGSEFPLIEYNDVIKYGEVKAGNANDSRLYKAIVNKDEEIMPPASYNQLTNNEIELIYVWIEQGANNN